MPPVLQCDWVSRNGERGARRGPCRGGAGENGVRVAGTTASGFAPPPAPTSPDCDAPGDIATMLSSRRRHRHHGTTASLAPDRTDAPVTPLRRFIASLTCLLMVAQVTLVGGGVVCPAHRGGAAHGPISERHAAHAAMTRATAAEASATLSTPAPAHCDMTALPGACRSMVACSFVALSTAAGERAALRPADAPRADGRATPPPSRSIAPELPPPRA